MPTLPQVLHDLRRLTPVARRNTKCESPHVSGIFRIIQAKGSATDHLITAAHDNTVKLWQYPQVSFYPTHIRPPVPLRLRRIFISSAVGWHSRLTSYLHLMHSPLQCLFSPSFLSSCCPL